MGLIAATTFIKNIRFNLPEPIADGSLTDANAGTEWLNSELLENLNKAKDALWEIVKDVRDDYFETTGATISLVAATKEYSLATAFRQLRGIKITTSGYEYIQFRRVDQEADEFHVVDAYPATSNANYIDELIYDIIGSSKIKFANFPPTALTASYDYIGVLSDFTLSDSSTLDLNDELREYMEAYATMISLGKKPTDKRLEFWMNEVKDVGRLHRSVIRRVAKRNIRESRRVQPYNP